MERPGPGVWLQLRRDKRQNRPGYSCTSAVYLLSQTHKVHAQVNGASCKRYQVYGQKQRRFFQLKAVLTVCKGSISKYSPARFVPVHQRKYVTS